MMRGKTNPGVPDRSGHGPQNPRGSAGRHAPSSTEPAQARGPTKPASQGRATPEGRMTQPQVFVGIDGAQLQMEVALRPEGQFAVSTDETGGTRLVERLRAVAPGLVVLEAPGGYEIPVTGALAAAQLPVVVVNPGPVRDVAKATGPLAKTDTLDAQPPAHFAEVRQPAVRPLPDEHTQALAALVTRRRQLVARLTAEKNRLRQASTRKSKE